MESRHPDIFKPRPPQYSFFKGKRGRGGGGEGEKKIYLAKNISTVTWFETSAQYYCFP